MRNFCLAGSVCLLIALITSCQSKMICPAFQSSFIYNDEQRENLFAYFNQDSLPIGNNYVAKNKYGIIEQVNRNKRSRQMRTVEMEIVFPGNPDTEDSTLTASNEVTDLTLDQTDSLKNHFNGPVNHYNVEQQNYMKLYGEYLPKPTPELEEDEILEELETDSEKMPGFSNMTRKERRQAERVENKKRKEANIDAAQEKNEGSE